MSYVYIHKANIEIDTLEAKAVFQQHILDTGVIIKAYHADNSIFKAHEWQQACRNGKQ